MSDYMDSLVLHVYIVVSRVKLMSNDWTEPIERVLLAARDRDVKISTPRIGEVVRVHSNMYPDSYWWK